MQLDKKLFDDRDTAHDEFQQRDVVLEHGEDHRADRMPDSQIQAIQNADKDRCAQLLGAMRMILDRDRLDIGKLQMPPREARALIALQSAVEGLNGHGEFVYANDRRDLLERALGVLQPDLIHTDRETARALHAQFADLTERVALLRDELGDLEDAQDELLEAHEKAALEAVAAGDKPGPKPPAKPSDPDAARPPTTLTGPELPASKPVPTTLTGPELPAGRPAPTTLTGPELPEAPPAPSTLGDGSPPEPGAPEAAGDQGKRPWWRRPFG